MAKLKYFNLTRMYRVSTMGPIHSEKGIFFLKIATGNGEGGLEGNSGPRTDTCNARSSRSPSREGRKLCLLSLGD